MKKLRVVIVAVVLLAMVGPAPSTGQIPVTDVVHIAQSFVLQYSSLVEHIAAYLQRVEALYRQYRQLETMYKNLESYGNGGRWQDLHGMLGYIDQLMQRAENLNAQYSRFSQMLEETFPGYKLPVAFSFEEQRRLRRMRESFTQLQLSIRRITVNDTNSQDGFAWIADYSKDADGAVEELEVANMAHVAQGLELTKITKVIQLHANATLIGEQSRLQREATAAAVAEQFLPADLGSAAQPLPGDSPRFTGIPPTWAGAWD